MCVQNSLYRDLEDALGLKEFVVEVEASLSVNEEERGWRNDLFLSTKYKYIYIIH